MASTTKVRTLGGGLRPKIGTNQPFIWESDASSAWGQMAPGEDPDSMAQIALDSGVRVVRFWCHGGDRNSYTPDFEPRPGEFWHGGAVVTRDGNGDITNTLYDSSTTPPTSNIKDLLDAYWAKGVRVSVDLCAKWMLTVGDKWNYNPYKTNNWNAAGNVRAVGTAGWLAAPTDFFTNAAAKAAFKDRIDAWLFSYGDHDAVEQISLGNELTQITFGDNQDFFDWVEEMSTYMYNQFGSKKPAIGLSSFPNFVSNDMSNAFGYIYGADRVVSWHSYNIHYTLQQKMDQIDDMRGKYSTFSFEPTYTGETRKYQIRVEENWGFGPGPTAVPDTEIDINIQGNPVTHTLAYRVPPNDTVTPYPHERMFAFLGMVLDPTMIYMRWPDYIDGETGALRNSYVRIMEIMEAAKDFYDTAVFHPDDMERWEDNVSSSGVLDFKAALKLEEICLTFVLVGSGNQTIDFGTTGTWTLVTYDWEGDGADSWQRIVNETSVNAAATAIAFGDYTDGFCPGYLIKSTDYRNPVQTTITTEVVVAVI